MLIKKMFRTTLAVQMVAMLSATVNTVIDGIVIGRCLGVKEMTAYGYVTPVLMVVTAFGVLMAAGTSGSCGRIIGNGDKEKISGCFSTIFATGLIIGLLFLCVIEAGSGGLAGFLSGTSGAQTDIRMLIKEYLVGYGFAVPPTLLMIHLTPILQLDGNPRLSVAAMTAMSAANAVLDVLSGLILHGGMFGMAMATTLSSYLGLCIMLCNFLRKDHLMIFSPKRMRMRYVRMLFGFGISASALMFFGTCAMFILNNIMIRFVSASAVAALAAVNAAGTLCTSIGLASRVTIVTLTSMFEGEQDEKSERELMEIALKEGSILNLGAMFMFIILASYIMSLFLPAATEAYDMSVSGFRCYAAMMLFFSCNMMFSGYYQGKRLLALSVAMLLLDKLVCVCMLAGGLVGRFGVYGVWAAFPLGSLSAMLLSWGLLCIRIGKLCVRLSDLLCAKEKSVQPDIRFLITSGEDVPRVSAAVQTFCMDNGVSSRNALVLALATEELANNVVNYGFRAGRSNQISVRVTGQGTDWQLRIRDNCPLFDPQKYVRLFEKEDITEHIGIRMIAQMAADFQYFNSMNMNQVVVRVYS